MSSIKIGDVVKLIPRAQVLMSSGAWDQVLQVPYRSRSKRRQVAKWHFEVVGTSNRWEDDLILVSRSDAAFGELVVSDKWLELLSPLEALAEVAK